MLQTVKNLMLNALKPMFFRVMVVKVIKIKLLVGYMVVVITLISQMLIYTPKLHNLLMK